MASRPELRGVVAFDRSARGFGQIRTLAGLLGQLRNARFDLAIDLQGLFRSGLFAWATAAPVRVGLAGAREGAARFYTHCVEVPHESKHAVDRLMQVARAFGAPAVAPRFLCSHTQVEVDWAQRALAGLHGPRVVFNLGARWPTKRWPPEHFAEVARRAHEELGASVITVGAPEDRPLVETFRRALRGISVADFCGQTTLPQLSALAAACDLFVSNDTGPMHIAAATGTRVVGIFTCTQPEKTGPYGANGSVVGSRIWCAGHLLKKCSRLDCMTELGPQRVWQEVKRALQHPITAGAE